VIHFLAIQKQFPVGQGGLHLTQLFRCPGDNNPFSFVYDCGGEGSTAALKRQMSMLRNALRLEKGVRHIDLMAISHLHRDHINGFEMLVGATSLTIGTLLLPHYDETDIALVLASAAADGVTAAELAAIEDVLRNPERWFTERGVRQIRFVTPDDGEGGDGIVPEPPDDLAEGTAISETGWVLKFIPQGKTVSVARIILTNRQTGVNSVVWQFMPYARRQKPAPASPGDRTQLKRDVDLLLQRSGNGFRPLNIAPQNAKVLLAGLTKAYLKYCPRGSWNPISLTLASGTTLKNLYLQMDSFHFYHWYACYEPRQGSFWMHTGDAMLSGGDGAAWLKYFKRILELATVFQAPHHGSRKNLDGTTVSSLPGACTIAYATCRNIDPNHPHPTVRNDLNAHGLELLEITQDPHSEFVTFIEIIVP
jgi:hypothetical protein